MKLIYKHGVLLHGEIIKYPDGQQQVKLDMTYFNCPKEPITIRCSVRNFQELEVLLCIVGALKSADLVIGRIEYIYLFGLRSDRKFEVGSCNYVEHVLAPIIKCLDDACLWPSKFLQPHGRATYYFHRDYGYSATLHCPLPDEFKHSIRIAGDESAKDLVSYPMDSFDRDPLYFIKARIDGKINSIHLPDNSKRKITNSDLPILIMDDLCDGGATFIAEAQYLRDTAVITKDRKIYLFVYHGLFTKGFDELFKHFDRIYMTNSYGGCYDVLQNDIDKLKIIDVWSN